MRSIWNGSIGAGLVQIPVKLGAAVSDNKLPLHQVRAKDGSRVQFKRVAVADGQEVAYSDLAMGYETGDGQMVVITDEDFKRAYGDRSRNAKILMFTDPGTVPRLAAGKSYHLQPTKGGEKTYALLVSTLERNRKVAIVSVAIRDRQHLGTIYPDNGYLVLELMSWAADVRTPDFPAPEAEISKAEADLADQLVATMSGTFKHAEHQDETQTRLSELIQGKIERGQVLGMPVASGESPSGGRQAQDLMSVLKAQVEAAGGSVPAQAPRKRTPRRKAVTS